MPRFALLFLGFLSFCVAADRQIELIAQSVTHEGNTTRADGDVALISDGRFIRADHLILCRDTGEAEMFGNVFYSQPATDMMISDYLWFKNSGSTQAFADRIFTMSGETGLWLSGNEAKIDGNISSIADGAISGCNPAAPDWSIRFSSAEHDRGRQWVSLYNGVFYAGRVPVFYLPYFSYHTDRQRHSGLLFPRVGTSKTEGVMYEQPAYIAPYDEWDVEIAKQWRDRRGEGESLVFRFVDSANSKGTITLGQFQDSFAFAEENNIDDRKKKGGSLEYERTKVFTGYDSIAQEGFTIDYQDFNDIEYQQLFSIDPKKKPKDIDYMLTNKFDYFYKNDDIYAGVYARHFKDYQNKNNNGKIAQIMPQSHLHLLSRPLLFDQLLINADLQHRNFTRKEGVEANDLTLSIPLSYHLPLFDDYLLLSAIYQADHYQINYSGENSSKLEKGTRNATSLTLQAETMLAKPYESFFHTIAMGTAYNDPLLQSINGDFTDDFYTKVIEEQRYRTLNYYLTQFFYTNEGKEFFRHRLTQGYNLDTYEKRELINEFQLSAFDHTLTNEMRYSHESGAVTISTTTLEADFELFDYSLTHLYQQPSGKEITKRYVKAEAGFDISARHRLFASYERDLLESADRGFGVAHTYRRGCWQSELSFTRETKPYSTTGGYSDSKLNDIIFLRLTLVPFGELSQQLYSYERNR
ncbi:LPS-assembly protein LptD [Campylobacterota bacterium]|nr:LPS-assembly protein LptD [Campylobacterota bacterium]